MTADLARATGVIARLQAEVQSQSVLLATTQSDNAGLAQRLADRAAEVVAVNQQLTHARTQFEHYQESSVAQRTEERQSFERRIAQQDHELGRLRHRLELKQSTAAQHAGQLARMVEENERLHGECRAAQQDLAQLRSELAQATSQATEMLAARPPIMAKQELLQRELADSRTVLAVHSREIALVNDRLADAERRAQALAQEKLDLLQRPDN
ncbi:MAG TPA: hypothetical protein VGP06_19565 [Janthinobacterium sp.]|nr:hypothetical protein [Janthinobacterium sp.]